MRKKLIVMFLSLVLVFQHSFSFAQSTSSSPENDVCGAPAPMMLLYQQFQSEMASALLGGGLGEKIFEATVSPWGLFTSKVLRLPTTDNSVADSLLTSLWNNVRRLGQASLTTVALLTLSALSVGSSNLEGLSILWQDRVIVREWKTLLQIETKLSQIAYHLGKQANIVAQLENTNNLKRILEKYQEAGLFTGVAGSSNASYFDILSQLAIMNSAMKIFISTTATAGLSAYHSEKLFNVQFASGAYTQLKNDYRSVRTPYSACSEVFDNLASNAKKAVGGVGTATKDSGKIITDASNKLKQAFGDTMTHIIRKGKAEEYFSPEELAQVGSICGIDNIATMTQKQMLGCEVKLKLASAKSSLKKTWNDTKKAFQSTRMVKKVDEDTNIPEPPQQSQKTVGEMYVDASLEEAFGNSFSTVSTVYEEMQGDLIAMEFSVSLFSSLLQQIDELEGKVIGANGSGLIKVLNDICTYQCANKGK